MVVAIIVAAAAVVLVVVAVAVEKKFNERDQGLNIRARLTTGPGT